MQKVVVAAAAVGLIIIVAVNIRVYAITFHATLYRNGQVSNSVFGGHVKRKRDYVHVFAKRDDVINIFISPFRQRTNTHSPQHYRYNACVGEHENYKKK